MAQEIGESREAWGWDVWRMAEDVAQRTRSDKPYYVVFAAKPDQARPNAFRQGFKTYYQRPPALIGILVWYVDKEQGIFQLVPELSIPPDVPVDSSLLSKEQKDASPALMEAGQRLGILLA